MQCMKQYSVAVVVYETGNEGLVFQEQPEVLIRKGGSCSGPEDVDVVAAEVAREVEEKIIADQVEDEPEDIETE